MVKQQQFLESRGSLDKELVDIIDRIYKEPHETMDDIKRQLRAQFSPGSAEWEKEVTIVVEQIGKIGDDAQNRRPDNVRVRKARAEQSPELSQVDLESRCKWYTGTLHLMVRKMWDEQRPNDKKLEDIQRIVDDSLKQFKSLKDELARRLGPEGRLEAAQEVEDLCRFQEQVKAAAGNHTWLIGPLQKLVEKAAESQSVEVTDIVSQEVWSQLKLELLHLRPEPTEGEQETMCSADSLETMHELIKEQVERDKQSILAALDQEESD